MFDRIRRLYRWMCFTRQMRALMSVDIAEQWLSILRPYANPQETLEIGKTLDFFRVAQLHPDENLREDLRILVNRGILPAHPLELGCRNMQSFAQEGEDLILERIFGHADGFYVDVGAHHPFRFSNTFLLYNKGWRGINIEPDAEGFELLKKFRPRDINLNTAILRNSAESLKNTATFYRFHEPALNSFDEAYASEMQSKGYSLRETIEVEFTDLASVLDRHAGTRRIDLLSIDTEGTDLDVLRSNDWTRFRPRVVIVELLKGESGAENRELTTEFLTGLGYVLHSVLYNSRIYVDERQFP